MSKIVPKEPFPKHLDKPNYVFFSTFFLTQTGLPSIQLHVHRYQMSMIVNEKLCHIFLIFEVIRDDVLVGRNV